MGYRVGIVGCGGMGRWYASGFHGLGCDVVACVDPDPERAKLVAQRVGGAAYTDHKSMLEIEKPDIVAVCTWPSTHRDITIDAVKAGVKGVITEKPIAITLSDADDMIEQCERHGVVFSVGHQHRLSPWARAGRELIQSGAIGTVELIWGHCSLDLMNNGTHVIDTIHSLNGDARLKWVIGQIDHSKKKFGDRNHPDLYAEDASVGRIQYENGVNALIDLGERARQDFAFQVIGTDGVIQLEIGKVRYIGKETDGWVDVQLPDGEGGREKIKDFLDALRNGTEPVSSGRRGRDALEVIIGVFSSVKQRAVIDAPVDEKTLTLKSLIESQ